MEPGALIFSLLKQAAPVVALLGYADGGVQKYRIYPILAPQNTPFPYLTYQVINQNGNETMGCVLEDDARVQLSIFAATYMQVWDISAATRAALANTEVDGVVFTFDGNRDQASDPTYCYFRTQDYLLTGLTP